MFALYQTAGLFWSYSIRAASRCPRRGIPVMFSTMFHKKTEKDFEIYRWFILYICSLRVMKGSDNFQRVLRKKLWSHKKRLRYISKLKERILWFDIQTMVINNLCFFSCWSLAFSWKYDNTIFEWKYSPWFIWKREIFKNICSRYFLWRIDIFN